MESICTTLIPLPTRRLYNCVQTSSLIPRGETYYLRAVNMLSFGNSGGKLATRMVLSTSPADVVVSFETSPVYVYIKPVLVSWMLSPISPVPLQV